MTESEILALDAPNVPNPSEEPAPTEVEEIELDSLGIIGEEIAVLAIENEERHEEILECLRKLENSSETQNPVSQAVLTELTTLKSELAELRGMIVSLQTSLTAMSHSHQADQRPSESPTETVPVENPSEQNPERSTEEPAPEEIQSRKKRRIL